MDDSKVVYKSKIIYIVISIILGSTGAQKLYAKRYGAFFWWIVLLILLNGCEIGDLMYFVIFIDIIAIACKSNEKFLIYCNKKQFKKLSREDRISYAKDLLKKNANSANNTSDVSQLLLNRAEIKKDDIAIKVPGEEVHEEQTHNHIKPDEKLASYVEKSQDKMDRFQNNNYFPSVDSSKIYDRKSRIERIKELKEELKDGLISKEDYNEMISKL